MIVEFSVENFRSIRDRRTLSLVANNKDDELPGNAIDVSLPGLGNTRLLRSAIVYGANASGKSNLLKAVGFMRDFVAKSAVGLGPGSQTGVVPYLLDTDGQSKPSHFEMTLILEGTRYQYGFVLDRDRVHEEWLYAYPLGRAQRWFHRSLDVRSGDYRWDFSETHFKGDNDAVSSKTRDNALFLSVGAQWNHEQLTQVYAGFKRQVQFLDFSILALSGMVARTANMLYQDEQKRRSVAELMGQADLGIRDVLIQKVPGESVPLPEGLPEEIRDALTIVLGKGEVLDVRWLHSTADRDEPVQFTETAESAGTLKYFSLLGPWIDALLQGRTIFVDEIGANMHPVLLRSLVKAVHTTSASPPGAQVVLTTHDTNLLDGGLFRRDQVWFTEKDKTGATDLYPLTDYKPRKDEALQKGYLAGRYGAIPFLRGELTF